MGIVNQCLCCYCHLIFNTLYIQYFIVFLSCHKLFSSFHQVSLGGGGGGGGGGGIPVFIFCS